ncbi:MAG: hypothetical protein ACRDJE_13650 [Dehalococcoidia bacterium]
MSALLYVVLSGAAGLIAGINAARIPYAVAACSLAALIVSVTVSLPLGDQGPHLLDVAVIPATAGALVGALGMRFVLSSLIARWE